MIEKTDYRYIAHQTSNAESLQLLTTYSIFYFYCIARHKLAWLSLTRTYILSFANMAPQTTSDTFTATQIRAMNKVIKHIKWSALRWLLYDKLDRSTLCLLAISGVSFRKNADLSSQLGHIILLTDHTELTNVISFLSYKSKRVVRSVLGVETYAFADTFDAVFTFQDELKHILCRKVAIAILTNLVTLLNIIIKSSRNTERRLMIDLNTVKQTYKRKEIHDIGWIKATENLVDAFIKATTNATLETLLETGQLNWNFLQWVIRKRKHKAHDLRELKFTSEMNDRYILLSKREMQLSELWAKGIIQDLYYYSMCYILLQYVFQY